MNSICFSCKKFGHLRKDCPMKRSERRTPSASKQSENDAGRTKGGRRSPRQPITHKYFACVNCKKSGHIEETCVQPKKGCIKELSDRRQSTTLSDDYEEENIEDVAPEDDNCPGRSSDANIMAKLLNKDVERTNDPLDYLPKVSSFEIQALAKKREFQNRTQTEITSPCESVAPHKLKFNASDPDDPHFVYRNGVKVFRRLPGEYVSDDDSLPDDLDQEDADNPGEDRAGNLNAENELT